jgi:hypothetical protein
MKNKGKELLNKIGLLAIQDEAGETILAFNIRLFKSEMAITQETITGGEAQAMLDQLTLLKESMVRPAQDIVDIVAKQTNNQFSASTMKMVLEEYTREALTPDRIQQIYSGKSPTKICLCFDEYYMIEIVLATTFDKAQLVTPTIH